MPEKAIHEKSRNFVMILKKMILIKKQDKVPSTLSFLIHKAATKSMETINFDASRKKQSSQFEIVLMK